MPLKDTAQKHVINTSFDPMALSTDTDGTTEIDNTWKNPVLAHMSRQNFGPMNLGMGQGCPKPNFDPSVLFQPVPQKTLQK